MQVQSKSLRYASGRPSRVDLLKGDAAVHTLTPRCVPLASWPLSDPDSVSDSGSAAFALLPFNDYLSGVTRLRCFRFRRT